MKPGIYIGREPELHTDILTNLKIKYQKLGGTFFLTLDTQEKIRAILEHDISLFYYEEMEGRHEYQGII